jgi:hypothetical protein
LSRLYSIRAASPYYVVLLATCLLACVFIFGQWQRNLLSFISELLSPIIAILAVVSAVMAVAVIGVRGNRLALVWFSLMLGVVIWFLSEVVWAVYPLVLGVPTPFPSIADVFGLVGYAPILVGLVLQTWPLRESFRTKRMLSVVLVTLGSAFLGLITLMQAIPSSQQGSLTLVVDYAYPILDFATLAVAVPVLLILLKGTFWRPFEFLVLGLALALTAHMLSAWTTSNGSYYPGHPLELLFDWGYLSAALGFFLMRQKMKERSL